MKIRNIESVLKEYGYPGRGIIAGKSEDGRAVFAYFITGRSINSKSRVLTERGGGLFVEPCGDFCPDDPSLFIYPAVIRCGNMTIVANGDQSVTLAQGLKAGIGAKDALLQREYEPDAPHYTPRISCVLTTDGADLSCLMSVLRREGGACSRDHYEYSPAAGEGRFICTYSGGGDALGSFEGDPVPVAIPDGIDGFTDAIWDSLDPVKRVALYVEYTALPDGKTEKRLKNQNERT